MNISRALVNLEKIKEDVLKDGRIDEKEVDILLEFLEPYTRTYHSGFSYLSKLLHEAKTLGMNPKRSLDIAKELDNVSYFLRMERRVERVLGYLTVGIALFFAFYLLIR